MRESNLWRIPVHEEEVPTNSWLAVDHNFAYDPVGR